MASNIIFQSKFNIKDIDGKKFDKGELRGSEPGGFRNF